MEALMSVLSVAVLAACGGAPEAESREIVGESSEAVLYAPPAPASGNIYDSTTYLGPVAIGESVQTYFTQNPQYYSFSIQVPAHSQLKLEATHLGSSMYLDTGLFLYGPKDASGSYGTTVVAQDDDAGYGELSRITLVSLEQGGEYLAVVSSSDGAGKRFRLQVDCMGWECLPEPPPPAPADAKLTVVEEAITSQLKATLDAANVYDGSFAVLRRFDFGWPYEGEASLDLAAQAALKVDDYYLYRYDPQPIVYTYDQFLSAMYSRYQSLHPAILATYGNGSENVQVKRYYRTYSTGPNGDHWDSLFVILFPVSHKVVVFEQQGYEI